MGDLEVRTFSVDNGEGWLLALRRYSMPSAVDEPRRPVVILPGYGMNSFIFCWHPEGQSMAEFFAGQGFEFWTVDLRAQGDSVPDGGSASYRMEDVGITDLTVVIDHILEHTDTGHDQVDLVGCSLGATYGFIHVALVPDHRVASMVAIGGPLRWTRVNPALRLAFSSPTLAGMLPFKGTSLMAELALPLVAGHAPGLLSIYMRAENVDLQRASVLVRTVEDPVPTVNAQIARWIIDKDLWIHDENVTEAIARFTGPFLCAFGNADGIVPRSTAMSAFTAVGSRHREVLELGNDHIKMAHADPYVSRYSHEQLFQPMADWLSNPTSSR
jgi:pimeloyl-ACP methyl ester carboxylesterase